MNKTPSRITWSTFLVAFSSALVAQTTESPTPEANEEPITISPFVIDSTRDRGYRANNTLAGSRLRTNLGDLATSIQVVTKEMLQDTASTGARDILVYTTSTEVGGIGGNFSGTGGPNSEGYVTERGNFRAPITRVRGLAGADLTRDYFPTSIAFDSYNTERVEINRGANAALFGLGSPAGIINNSLIKAKEGNFGSATLSAGSYGTHRQSADYNVAPGNGTVAVRVAGVRDHREFEQDPAFSTDRRGFAAVTWDPKWKSKNDAFSGVTFRGNFETGNLDSNMPRTTPPIDVISRWFALGKPIWNPTSDSLAATNRRIYSHNLTFALGTLWSDPNSNVPGSLGTIGIPNPARPPSAVTGLPIMATYAAVARLVPANLLDAGDPFIAEPMLSDERVLDFRRHMIDGPNKSEFKNFNAHQLTGEARFFRDRLGVELAFAREYTKSGAFDTMRSQQDSALHVDINTTLLNGDPNPNYGRPYLATKSYAAYTEDRRRMDRATAYYAFDFKDVMRSSLAEWLGKHTLTVATSRQERNVFSKEGFGYIADRALELYGQSSDATSLDYGISPMFMYLGPSILNATSLADVRLTPVTQSRRPDLLTTSESRFVVWNPTTRRWEVQPIGIIRQDPENLRYAGNANRYRDRVDSTVAVLQSNLLKENLIVTTSWREDRARSYGAVPTVKGVRNEWLYDEEHFLVPQNPTLEAKGDTIAYGFVAKVPQQLLKRWPSAPSLSFFLNKSENFQPSGIRRNPYGVSLAPPSGDTEDFGFSISSADGRFDLRTTWYKTTQNQVSSSLTSVIHSIASIETGILEGIRNGVKASDLQSLSPGVTQAEVDQQVAFFKANPFPLAAAWNFTTDPTKPVIWGLPIGTTDTLDYHSKGVEIEAVINPLSTWRIAINVAKQETMQTNTGTTTLKLIEERMAIWDQVPILPTTPSFSANVKAQGRNVLAGYYSVAGRDGTSLAEVRKWRANLMSNYILPRGTLKGLGFGGAYRWEDKAAIGYQTRYDAALRIYRLELDKPWFDEAEGKLDAWISYERKLWNKRVGWKVQFNVRNLLDEDDLVPIYRNPDGMKAAFRIPEGRRWELSSRFDF